MTNFEEHLKTARGIYEVGNSSLVEVTKAEADFAMADRSDYRRIISTINRRELEIKAAARDLRSAALSLTNAIERARSSAISVKYAEDNLALAQGRYEVGVGSPLEVSDAVSTLANSRYTLYQALYDAQVARTELDEAMGHLPPELNIEGNM